MNKIRAWRGIYVFVSIALLIGLFPIQTSLVTASASSSTSSLSPSLTSPLGVISSSKASNSDKVLVDSQDLKTIQQLASSGASLLVDYGSFSLWEVPAGQGKTLASLNTVSFSPDINSIQLRNTTIDTTKGAADPVPAGLQQTQSADAQLWLIQFVGPIKGDWLDQLQKQGLEMVAYIPSNAYVVWGTGASLDGLRKQISATSVIQWEGAYQPAYRLATALQPQTLKKNPTDLVDVTVQFYNTAATQASLKNLLTLGGKIYKQPSTILNFLDVSLQVPAGQLVSIANWPNVFNVEQWVAPQLLDERQDQIIAGNITKTITGTVVPTGTGYLSWLASQGFSTNPADYPLVDVMDDGIDNGTNTPLHPDFYLLGDKNNPDRLVYNQNCTTDPLADGLAGHGNLNAGIVGGYNNSTGIPYQDSLGYRLGLGVSPYGRLGGTKIFNNAGNFDLASCGNTEQGVIAASFNAGAKITSNSWGADTAGAYTTDSQIYDALTRDATTAVAGNQQMLHVFAAGNAGSAAGTVGAPGSAKNVLTVGATENVRDDGVLDGCSFSDGNNADDIASFSSRGPTADSRSKPEIVAPGTHIQGPASQDPGFTGTGVCGGATNIYYPNATQNGITQTLYTWSSGTSHSTPAVAGSASLVYNYYQRVLSPGQNPTPAMLKALLINGSRYLSGVASGDTLPSPTQGWGDVALKNIFDPSNHYCVLINQSVVLTGTGQTYNTSCQITDPAKPLRVTLAWTDAPGSTTGNAYVNDLNLQVSFNGASYKGNVFNGPFSAPGGVYDARNNVENVFLPAGTTGSFGVRVSGANIAANAISGGIVNPQQDFVLVVENADPAANSTVLSLAGTSLNDLPPGGNANGSVDPGETIGLSAALTNNGNSNATGVTATLTTNNPFITITNGTVSYPTIAPGATVGSSAPFTFTVSPAIPCGQPITFTLTVNSASSSFTTVLTYQVGQTSVGAATVYTSTDVPKAIPDNTPSGITSTLPITAPGMVGKITVSVNVTHTWDGDVTLKLISPNGTTVTLVARRGSSGDNFTGTVFDDAAANSIVNGTPPYAGSYRPETPLNVLNDQPISGTWTLLASDSAASDTGTLGAWSLNIAPRTFVCQAPTPAPAASLQVSGYPSLTTVGASSPFTVTAKDMNGNLAASYGGTVAFSTNAASANLPPNYTFQPGDLGTHVFTASFNVTGTYAITATDTVSPSISGSEGGIVVQGAPATITATSGITQSASLNNPFPSGLSATVLNSGGAPVVGVVVTFTAPASGASAIFANNSNMITATTNASGIANTSPVRANAVAGSYIVTATTSGVAAVANFYLTNVSTTCSAYVVTSVTDDGSALNCGTLSYALTSANSFLKLNALSVITVTFKLDAGKTISVTGKLPPVKAGITVDGGSCAAGPDITLNGAAYSGDGLVVQGATIHSLRVTNFGGRQIVSSGGAHLQCVVANKTTP